MATKFKSIREYFFSEEGHVRHFVVPSYQRGYKWAVKYDEKPTAVENLMENLFEAIHQDESQQYFLQGVTVAEEDGRIILIDGQQRTTTLYLLLWCLSGNEIEKIDLSYEIRGNSKDFILNLKKPDFDWERYDSKGKFQDIYYFKEAIKQIKQAIKEESKNRKAEEKDVKAILSSFLLDKVNLLYIVIDKDKAVQTFNMMNGHKATMHQEELIKAEMLHVVSLPEQIKEKNVTASIDDNLIELKNIIASDWETTALRSKYAREWDRWLFWWNRGDVQEYFNVDNPMGLLLEYYFLNIKQSGSFSFREFKSLLSGKKVTKDSFKGLRDLQKSFEDIFNTPQLYNYLGLAMEYHRNKEDKFNIIKYFIDNKNNPELLREYAIWKIVGASHVSIVSPELIKDNNNEKSKEEYANMVYLRLQGREVYEKEDGNEGDGKEDAYKQLLRMNVMDMGDLKFMFKHFKSKKSLEHICPQHPNPNDTEFTNVQAEINEKSDGLHSIGNLLLLNDSVNSGLSNGKLFEKKKYLFDKIRDGFFLPHTLRVFSKAFNNEELDASSLFDGQKYWTADDVNDNRKYFFDNFERTYGVSPQNIENNGVV